MWTRDGTEIRYLNEGSLWNIRADFSGTATELAGTNVAGNGDDYRRVNVILNWFEELKERVPVP